MAYLVLARKYRPERFSDMIGQEHIARVLAQAIEQSRTHHAYLFCGVRGLGKTSAARILARCLVCEQGPSAVPCNVCEQCRAVIESRSVDVREIDGASNNSVEDIRSLREQVHYLPQSARKKIYIIDEVHMLSTSAFNALLKTLEEPPEHVQFIFATTDPHKVLPTILSRVSRLEFRRVTTEALADHLANILEKEGAGAEGEALRIIAQSGEGSVRDALTHLDKVLAFCADRSNILAQEVRTILGRANPCALSDIVDSVLEGNVKEILEGLDAVIADGADPRDVALGILHELRNLVVLRLTPDSQALVDEAPARLETLRERAQRCEAQQLSQLFDRLMRSTEALDRALNPRLALEMALIELAIAPPLIDISKAIAQLQGGGSPSATGTVHGAAPASAQEMRRLQSPSPEAQVRPQAPSFAQGARPSTTPRQAMPRPQARAEHSFAPQKSNPPPSRASDSKPSTPEGVSLPTQDPTLQTGETQGPPAAGPDRASTPPAAASPLAKELWSMVRGAAQPPSAPATKKKTEPSPEQTRPLNKPNAAQSSAIEQGQSPIDSGEVDNTLNPSPSLSRWFEMLEQLRAREESMMLAMLCEIGVERLESSSIVLWARASNFSRKKLQDSGAHQEKFYAWLRTHELDPSRLEWKDGEPSLDKAPSRSLFLAKARAQHRERIAGQARQQPEVIELLEHFDGEITHLRVLKDHLGQPLDPPLGRSS